MQEIIIKAKGIEKSYGKTKVLRGVSLDVGRGEILAIMGPSGSGKSTLLHSLAAITAIDDGSIVFLGDRIDNLNDKERTLLRRKRFGFVFQFGQLVPELSAVDNVALVALLNGEDKTIAYQRAERLLTEVGLIKKKLLLPSEMSGGEMQRVAIARAMAVEPEILFADEPTGSLDSFNSQRVMELMTDMARKYGMTIIMVTHEPSIAAYADREIVVRDGQISGVKK